MSMQRLKISWNGPFDWPQARQRSPLKGLCGVYMQTVKNDTGYVVYGVGITKRPVSQRFGEHRRAILKGKYTLLDLDAMRQGIRQEIWHGLWAGHDSDERKAEFAKREEELKDVARQQMAACKIFVAEVSDVRIQHRMEAALMATLYDAPEPYCGLPDRGMHLVPRHDNELPITITNESHPLFVNLPEKVEI
ncbi:MAG: hypothetical protein MK161_14995 [Pirellulales bacterium]|nr:hypothetical protein [Pirellulales bacterium]